VLDVLTRFFAELHDEKIPYCHWKSNEHLAAGLEGLTDLDILVDGRWGTALDRVLAGSGFKRFPAVPAAAYPGIDDYLVFDPPTGRLVHLHLHYQLTLGERFLKGHRLPWEHFLLTTSLRDPESGVHIADPHAELVLLLVRAALKVRLRDQLAGDRPYLREGSLREFQWLRERVDPDRLLLVGRTLLGEEAARYVATTLAKPLTARDLVVFRRALQGLLDQYRTFDAAEARWRRWTRELRARWHRVARRRGRMYPGRRTLPHGGRIIAFLGSDGSGKSTLVREIGTWLSWKVDVVGLYFGSGDGPASLVRRPLQWLRWARRRVPRVAAVRSTSPSAPDLGHGGEMVTSPHRRVMRIWWALSLAREKRRRLRLALRARNLCVVAICDRFPQNQIMGFTDGPLLDPWSDSRSTLLRMAARRERVAYTAATLSPPDMVIKLNVTPEVALARKPDMLADALPRRIEAIHQLTFPPQTRVVEIDANQPLPDVLLQVKRAVWEAL
jgi:hypothetical protein